MRRILARSGAEDEALVLVMKSICQRTMFDTSAVLNPPEQSKCHDALFEALCHCIKACVKGEPASSCNDSRAFNYRTPKHFFRSCKVSVKMCNPLSLIPVFNDLPPLGSTCSTNRVESLRKHREGPCGSSPASCTCWPACPSPRSSVQVRT